MHKDSSEKGSHTTPELTGATNDFAPIPQLESHFPASKGSIKWRPVMVLLLIVVLIIAVVLWAMYVHRNTQSQKSAGTAITTEPSDYLVGRDKYVCGVAALSAVLCENVETHTITKYEVPHALGAPYTFRVSPDGSKILLGSFANKVQTPNIAQHFYIVGRDFTLIKQLPNELLTQDGYNYAWLADSKSLVYDLRTDGGNGQYGVSQLYIYNLDTGKTHQLTSSKSGIGFYDPITTRDGQIVAYGRASTYTTPEELAVISSTDGNVKDIDTSAMYKNLDPQTRIFYNESSDIFYASGTEASDESKNITVVAHLVSSGGELKLTPLATYQKDFDSPPTVTTRGTLLDTSSVTSGGKLEFYDGHNPDTKLSVNLNMFTASIHSFVSLPFVEPARTNELTSSDYVYEYGTPPPKLDQFVRQLVTKDCRPGQYMPVSLVAFDGDQQAAVEQGTCGNTGAGALNYYEYKDGAYKDVISSEEGVSCQDAASLGLSKVVLPDCIPPGQGP